ncbi:MAG: hypothetical protein AABZ47_00790 [Planctomycetota bacterium]
MRHTLRLGFGVLLTLAGCHSASVRLAPGHSKVPFFKGLGKHHRPVSTTSPQAQRYFDQGLLFTFAFNHDEAIRSYKEAARLDPNCAMAWWGVALCNGPHINNPAMSEAKSQAAWESLQKALALLDHANPTERLLIQAVSKRYAAAAPKDRKPLDEAYAKAMREVWLAHRGDPDIGALYVESLMDLQPWDLWTKDWKPKGATEEIVSTLEEVMRVDLYHPGANHLYIHAVEASAHPEKAVEAANRLRDLAPGVGHLVHMPAHIDVRTGKWDQASQSNRKAIRADRAYRKISPRQDFYRLYMAHNHHFLSYASMMEGRKDEALQAAHDMLAGVPSDWAEKNAKLIDGYTLIDFEVKMRFGLWDEILMEPQPPSFFPIKTAFWHFVRGTAFAAKGQVEQAKQEKAAFLKARQEISPEATMAINPAKNVLDIAEHMLNGEIAFRQKKIDEAVGELRQAIKIEDDLQYMEPPDWIQPVRHTLGAILLDAGRAEEAEKVYREDLAIWPENGWSLYGLSESLKARGAGSEADDVAKRFRKAWSRADTQIGTSCLCVRRS